MAAGDVLTSLASRILVICTDQQRWDSLGCYGSSAVWTPNIDRLAREGTLFERCYTVNPVCAPSRATMLTGTYPHQHGVWANGVALDPARGHVVHRLAAAGYRTGLIGKLHLRACLGGRTEDPRAHGFDWVRWAHDPTHTSPDNAYHAWLRDHFPSLLVESTNAPRPADAAQRDTSVLDGAPAGSHYSRWVADQAIEFITQAAASEPWLLWVNFFDPHHPFVAPPEYVEAVRGRRRPDPIGSPADLDDRPAVLAEASARSYAGHARGYQEYTPTQLQEARDSYWAMIDLIDEQVGRILEAAEAGGPAEQLFVVFTSDHGEMLGDHGLMLKGPMMYEGAVRVPGILRWPGRIPAGKRVEGLVSLVDIAGTLASAGGVEPAEDDQGRDLIEVAAGRQPPHRVVLAEYRDSGHPYQSPVWTTMVADSSHKLVVWHGGGEGRDGGELYDLAADPGELVNLWPVPDRAEVRARLLSDMADFLALPGTGWGTREAAW